MAKIDELRADVNILQECVKGLANEIETLRYNKNPDFSLITKKQKDKTEAQNLLNDKIRELEIEELKEKKRPITAKQQERQDEFDKKNTTYSIVSSSYMKALGN